MSLLTIRKQLKDLEKAELLQLLEDLYKQHKAVKQHLELALNFDEAAVVADYTKELKKALYGRTANAKPKLLPARKAITAFMKFEVSAKSRIEILLAYVQFAFEKLNDHDYAAYEAWHGNLGNNIIKFYDTALQIAFDYDELENFKEQFHKWQHTYFYWQEDMEWSYSVYFKDGKYRKEVEPKIKTTTPTNQGQKFEYDF